MTDADPILNSMVQQPAVYLLSAICGNCGRPLSGDRDFGWWVHTETGNRHCEYIRLTKDGQV